MGASGRMIAGPTTNDINAELALLHRVAANGRVKVTRGELRVLGELIPSGLAISSVPAHRQHYAGLTRAAAIGFMTLPTTLSPLAAQAQTVTRPGVMLAAASDQLFPPIVVVPGTRTFPFTRSMAVLMDQPVASVTAIKETSPLRASKPRAVEAPVQRTAKMSPGAIEEPAQRVANVSPAATKSREPVAKPLRITNGDALGVRLYRVSAGDTLYGIARRQLGKGSRWRELAEANTDRLKNGLLLKVGQTLVLPDATAALAMTSGSAQVSDGTTHNLKAKRVDRMYRVVAGDNLYAIAAKHLGKASRWRELAALNRASLGNKNLVYPNQWLILPTKVT